MSALYDKRIVTVSLVVLVLAVVAVFAVLISTGVFTSAAIAQQEGPPGKVMAPRMPVVQQQLDILQNHENPPKLLMSTMTSLPAILLGTPMVLRTKTDAELEQETTALSNRSEQDLVEVIQRLTDLKMGVNPGDPEVRAMANQVEMLLEGALSVKRGLEGQVQDLDPNKPVPLHLEGDREIANPFLPMGPPGVGHPPTETVITGNVSKDEPFVVVKEIFGFKAKLFSEIIPWYSEAWDPPRGKFLGLKEVWHIQWVPYEHVKTLVYTVEKDKKDKQVVEMRVIQVEVPMPGLLKFWGFYNPPPKKYGAIP